VTERRVAGATAGRWGKPSLQGTRFIPFRPKPFTIGRKKLELPSVITIFRYPEHRGSPSSRLYCTVVGVTSTFITRVPNLVKYDQLFEKLRRRQLGVLQRPPAWIRGCLLISDLLWRQFEFAGLKKYNIPVLDPLLVTEVKASDAGLDMVGRDIILKGLKDIVLKNIK